MNTKRILIVDDDLNLRKTLAGILQKKGYVPITAGTGQAALDKTKEAPPAVALIDLRLEDISGLEVMRTIKEKFPATECIVVTGHASPTLAIEAINLGAYSYVQKPYHIDYLLVTIRRAIEKQESEQTLRESEEQYRLLVEAMNEGLGVTDEKGRLTYVNNKLCEMLGYTPYEIIGQSEANFVDEVGQQTLAAQMNKRRQGEHEAYELAFTRKDGQKIATIVSPKPIFDATGHFEGSFAVVTDITKRKQAEEALAWEAGINATVAELFKALLTPISIEDISSLILEHAKRLTGSEFGFVGYIDPQTDHLVCPTMTRDIWDICQIPDKNIAFREFGGLWGWVLKNRKPLIANSPANDPRSSGIPPGHVPVRRVLSVPALIQEYLLGQVMLANPGRDYTEQDLALVERLASVYALALQRQHAEEMLRENEARLKAIFDFAGIAIGLTDTQGQWIQTNQYWEQMIGYSSQELRALSNRDITHPDDLSITRECEADLLTGRLDSYRIEKRYLHKKGHAIWVDVSVTPIRDKDDEIMTFISTITDITKRKQVEEALQDSVQKLQIAYKQAKIYAEELTQDITERKRAEQEIQKLNEELEQRVIDRTRELSALYDVTAVASESLRLDKMLERLLERVLIATRTDMGHIHLLDETGVALYLAVQRGLPPQIVAQVESIPVDSSLAGWVLEHGESLLVPDLAADSRAVQMTNGDDLAYVGVPMQARGRTLGVLSVIGKKEHLFNAEEVALLASVADQVGVAVENARLRQQTERAAVIEERERLARELHDSVTQLLYSMTLFAGAGERLARTKKLDDPENYLADLGEIAQQALKEMRLLVYELRPPALEQEGLAGALQLRLESVEERAGMKARLLVEQEADLPMLVEDALYRIAQEALNNALKHAAATVVTVQLHINSEQVTLEVADNGRGFDPDTTNDMGGMGLASMRERVERQGGSLTILSAPGEGTKVTANIQII